MPEVKVNEKVEGESEWEAGDVDADAGARLANTLTDGRTNLLSA